MNFLHRCVSVVLNHGGGKQVCCTKQAKEFSENFENDNTKRKTLYDLNVLKEFLDACDELEERN